MDPTVLSQRLAAIESDIAKTADEVRRQAKSVADLMRFGHNADSVNEQLALHQKLLAHRTAERDRLLEIADALADDAAELEKDTTTGAHKLTYRVDLWSVTGQLVGQEKIGAEDDDTAVAIAEKLCDACSDVSDGYELRQGSRLVGARSTSSLRMDATVLNAKTQAAVAEHEERMLNSRWAIAKSRRQLERLGRQIDP